MKASLEMKMEVWNDDTGEHLIVSEDSDGLGMMQFVYFADRTTKGVEIRWPNEQTPLVLEAIKRVSTFIAEKEERDKSGGAG